MLVIGSQALNKHGLLDRPMGKDLDVIAKPEELAAMLASYDSPEIIEESFEKVIFKVNDLHIEVDLTTVWSNQILLDFCNANEGIHYAPLDVLYALKMSHRFKKDSPHFYKTMHDIKSMREAGCTIPTGLQLKNCNWEGIRWQETYNYSHPKLNVGKDDFFNGDDIPYVYDHDSIHKAIASGETPAYNKFKPDENEVFCSRELFDNSPYEVKLLSVYEEASVLALERSVIPFHTDPD